jgi:thiol-disulfide isomerase/thioredoxin
MFKNKLLSFATSKNFFFILFIMLLFLAIGLYVYKNYVKNKLNKDYVANKEFTGIDTETDDSGVPKFADLYFFYTEWCPHCKTDMPVWNKFKKDIGENKVQGKTINFIKVDCDKDTAMAEKYNVEAYPTIKLVYEDKVIEYDAKTDIDTLHQFLKSSL